MPILTPSRQLRASRRLPVTILMAAIGTMAVAVPIFGRHLASYPWALLAGGFVVFAVLEHLTRTVGVDPPEISWDRENLHVSRSGETESIPWADFGGYRLTWDLPRGLKVYRASHWKPVEVDMLGFDDDQRSLLFTELAIHPIALPNKRLEPTRRMIKE